MRPLFALIVLTAVAYGQGSTPVVTSVTPTSVDAGGPAFTLTVTVNNFVSGGTVKWSGITLVTSAVNDTTLTATVPANLIAICGKALVTVGNASVTSNGVAVIVNPVLRSISPNSLPAGYPSTLVTAFGIGFSSNVHLTLNASGTRTDLSTNYGGTTTISANLPASALNGTFPVSLFVADSQGGISQTLPLSITYAQVTQIYPDTIYADILTYPPNKPTFTLQVGGSSFAPGAQVLWNGTPLATTYTASTLLLATVTADLVHAANETNTAARLVGVSVKNPGAVASPAINFTILPNPFGTTIISLNPPSVSAGSPAVTMTVAGERYTQGSTVLWVRTPLPTTFVSSTKLTAVIPVDLLAIEGSAPITISTPGIGDSNSVNFVVVTGLPSIANNGISPTSAVAGGPAFTMTVNGDGYVTASKVIGMDGLSTTYVNAKQLTVSVPASAIANPGQYKIQVVNPGDHLVSPQAPVFTVTAPPTPAPTLTGLNPNTAVPGGAAFTLAVTGTGFAANSVVQWNGAPLSTTFGSATQVTATVAASLIATAGTASVTVTGDGGVSNALPFTIAPLGPNITSGGILNAASSLPAIAPGTLIAIYGTNLATSTAQFSATPLPVVLGGTSVTINGTQVPLLYASAVQVNAQVPYETKIGTAKLIVQSNGVASPAVDFAVTATGPGVFTSQQHLLALNLSDGTLNSKNTPARPGQYITAYLTGQGAVNPSMTTGDVAPGDPLSLTVAPVQVKIGGVVASVPFAGMAPGFVGLMQMNIQIPDVPPGELTFEVSVGGVNAGATVISVAAKQ